MPTISITRPHSLSHKAAKDAAVRVVDDLRKRFDLACDWRGDEVTFDRPGVSGRLHVGRDALAIEVRLGLLLGALKSTIEREINAQLDQLVPAPTRATERKALAKDARTAAPSVTAKATAAKAAAHKSPAHAAAAHKPAAHKPAAHKSAAHKPAARKTSAKG